MPVTNYYVVNGRLRGQTTAAGRTNFLTDASGSVVTLMNSAGTVTKQLRYKPSGAVLSESGPAEIPALTWMANMSFLNLTQASLYQFVSLVYDSSTTSRLNHNDAVGNESVNTYAQSRNQVSCDECDPVPKGKKKCDLVMQAFIDTKSLLKKFDCNHSTIDRNPCKQFEFQCEHCFCDGNACHHVCAEIEVAKTGITAVDKVLGLECSYVKSLWKCHKSGTNGPKKCPDNSFCRLKLEPCDLRRTVLVDVFHASVTVEIPNPNPFEPPFKGSAKLTIVIRDKVHAVLHRLGCTSGGNC